jgi:hypothetical protein
VFRDDGRSDFRVLLTKRSLLMASFVAFDHARDGRRDPTPHWARSSQRRKLLAMDLNGNPVAKESDVPFKHLVGLMGITAAPNGDIWVADGSDDQLLLFPGERIKDGMSIKVPGLASPFDIVVDPQNRVWVSNSQSDTVLRFPADDPAKSKPSTLA